MDRGFFHHSSTPHDPNAPASSTGGFFGHLQEMSTGKKVALGVGCTAVAAGGLFFAKKMYDKHNASAVPGAEGADPSGSRGIPAELQPYVDAHSDPADPNNRNVVRVPTTATLGLGWEGANVNLDLIASSFDNSKKLLGFIQGSANRRLFDGALWHSGDDTSGGASGKFSSVSGDNENIIIDFRKIPANVDSVVVGVYLAASAPISKSYVRLLPLLTPENVGIDPSTMTHDVEATNPAEKHDFIVSFFADLDSYNDFTSRRGFVAGRFSRNEHGQWTWSPVREVVDVDPNYGLFPVLERYA